MYKYQSELDKKLKKIYSNYKFSFNGINKGKSTREIIEKYKERL